MASAAVIDVDALLLPIPGDAPAGQPLADTIRMQLDDLRKEPDPLDPSTAGRKSDWPLIIRICLDTLTNKSKDLIVAVRLMEASAKKDGVIGLRDGLQLVTRLVGDCSDRLHPMPGEGEGFDVWEGAMKWINDSSRGGQFPGTVGRVPIFTVQGNPFHYEDSIRSDRKKDFDDAIPAIKPDALRRAYEDWLSVRGNLEAMAKVMDEKMGSEVAPDFLSPETSGNIGNAVNRCIELIEHIAKQKGVPLADSPAAAAITNEASGNESHAASNDRHSGPIGIANNRDGLYRQVSEIADALERLEPHSPIPMLLRRCVRLGGMPFKDLIREMVRDAATLDELDRLLGVPKG